MQADLLLAYAFAVLIIGLFSRRDALIYTLVCLFVMDWFRTRSNAVDLLSTMILGGGLLVVSRRYVGLLLRVH